MQRETNRFDTQTARKENGPDKGGLHCACGLVSGRVVGGRIALFLTGGSRPLLRLRAQACLQYRVRAHRQEGIVGGAQFDPVVELGKVVADRLAGALASHLGVLNDLDGVAPSLVLQRAPSPTQTKPRNRPRSVAGCCGMFVRVGCRHVFAHSLLTGLRSLRGRQFRWCQVNTPSNGVAARRVTAARTRA